ncbi:MAG: hypothetical protein ACFFD4_20695 [Candidatus Odinarchaeota archaeon]
MKERVIISKNDKEGNEMEMEGILVTNFENFGGLNPLKKEILLQLGKKPAPPAVVLQNLRNTSKKPISKSTFYHNFRQLRQNELIRQENSIFEYGDQSVYTPVSGAIVFQIVDDFSIKEDYQKPQGDIYSEPLFKFFREFLGPGNTFNGRIVVGSPDPHGEYKARARDGHYAVQLAFSLGRYFHLQDFAPTLDQSVIAEKLKGENLIVIGGIYTNSICHELNEYLPVSFSKSYGLISNETNEVYTDDTDGIICKIINPFNKKKIVIVLAGLRAIGTKSTIIGLTKFSDKILENFRGKRVVRGYDSGTGKIDSIDIIE